MKVIGHLVEWIRTLDYSNKDERSNKKNKQTIALEFTKENNIH